MTVNHGFLILCITQLAIQRAFPFLWAKNPKFSYMVRQGGGGGGVVNQSCLCNQTSWKLCMQPDTRRTPHQISKTHSREPGFIWQAKQPMQIICPSFRPSLTKRHSSFKAPINVLENFSTFYIVIKCINNRINDFKQLIM